LNPHQKRRQWLYNLLTYHREELRKANYEQSIRIIMEVCAVSRDTAKGLLVNVQPHLTEKVNETIQTQTPQHDLESSPTIDSYTKET